MYNKGDIVKIRKTEALGIVVSTKTEFNNEGSMIVNKIVDVRIDKDTTYSFLEEDLELLFQATREMPTIINQAEETGSMVIHPKHYNQGEIEVKDAIRDWGLNFALGSSVKYIARSEYKEDKKQDLEKAIFFIQDEIDSM